MGATSALGSIAALAVLAPNLTLGVPSLTYILYPAIGTPIVLFKHRENIQRILKGQERRIGQKVELSEPVSGTADRA
jgi:glycerol-3-phosphate acyltransferase PlsY